MAERPTGTVTFLFSDIEGSTRLLGRLGPERYGAALATHRRILRDAFANHDGHEEGTEGDSFAVTFQRAADAVHAAAEGQRALAAHPWPEEGPIRVRMGIHTTDAALVDGTYVGLGVHRGARLGAAAHGGQVVLSQATAELLADEPEIALRDLGEHRLRDLPDAQHLYQLEIPGLPGDFPTLRTASAQASRRTNLPSQLTSFIGRERELAELASLSERQRLVTLIGVGGTGKTRLMQQVGTGLADDRPDGAWFAELAPISDPELVPAQVARALSLSEEPGRSPRDTLLDFLAAKSMLLMIDNCEHVIGAAADLVADVLAGCPQVSIMATSREALGVDGETIVQVPSMALPSSAETDGDEQLDQQLDLLRESEAVRLFTDRARTVVPTFEVTTANARAVVDICRRLDGIPLAIELAAARVRVLSVEEIDAGLGDRFRLLTGGRRGVLPRQQTLQALIDWSWDLLAEEDRRLLCRMGVFASSWSLDAATAVVARTEGGGEDRIGVLDGLARLVDRSLVIAEHTEPTRYRMLETIRQYALDKLVTSGEVNALRAAHLGYYLDLGLAAEHPLLGPEMASWLRRLDAEKDELRTALDWGLEAEPERAIRLTIALVPYWRARSFGAEASDQVVRAAEIATALPPPPAGEEHERTVLVARILAAAASAQAISGNGGVAPAYADRAVALAREANDIEALADALSALAMASMFSGHAERAIDLVDEVVEVARRRGDPWQAAMSEAGAALADASAGNLESAMQRQARATEFAYQSGNPFVIAFAALNNGRLAGFAGDLVEARRWFGEASRGYQEIGDERFILVARSDSAHALRRGGELDEAAAIYREVIGAWHHLGSRGAVANILESVAFIAIERQDLLRAARLLGAAEALRERAAATMVGAEVAEYEAYRVRLEAALDADAMDEAWRAGRRFATDEAIALALA